MWAALPSHQPQIKSLLSEMINGAPNTPEHKGVRCTLYLFQVFFFIFSMLNAFASHKLYWLQNEMFLTAAGRVWVPLKHFPCGPLSCAETLGESLSSRGGGEAAEGSRFQTSKTGRAGWPVFTRLPGRRVPVVARTHPLMGGMVIFSFGRCVCLRKATRWAPSAVPTPTSCPWVMLPGREVGRGVVDNRAKVRPVQCGGKQGGLKSSREL